MTQFLIEHFVKDYEDVEKISVRTAYGVLASIVGIFCNVFFVCSKIYYRSDRAQRVGYGGRFQQSVGRRFVDH